MKQTYYIFLSFVVLALASCGKEVSIEELNLPEEKLVIELQQHGSAITYSDQAFRVNRTATLFPKWNFHTADNAKVSWKADNENITFKEYSYSSNSIYIIGAVQGKTIITAEIEGRQATLEVEVLPLADFTTKQDKGSYRVLHTYVASYNRDGFAWAKWDFGDGEKSAFANPEHTYEADGKYTVSLVVTDADGNEQSYQNTVFVYLDAFCEDSDFEKYLPDYKNLDEMKAHYIKGGLGDGTCKKFLLNVLNDRLEPIRQRRKEYEKDIPGVYEILRRGTEEARKVGAQTLAEVRHAMRIDYFDDKELIAEQAKRFSQA